MGKGGLVKTRVAHETTHCHSTFGHDFSRFLLQLDGSTHHAVVLPGSEPAIRRELDLIEIVVPGMMPKEAGMGRKVKLERPFGFPSTQAIRLRSPPLYRESGALRSSVSKFASFHVWVILNDPCLTVLSVPVKGSFVDFKSPLIRG